MTDREMLEVAKEEARRGRDSGGIPIGAALFGPGGELWGKGHNRRVIRRPPSTARSRLPRRRVASPYWARRWRRRCRRVIASDSSASSASPGHREATFSGGHEWLAENGVGWWCSTTECVVTMELFIAEHPELWYEDTAPRLTKGPVAGATVNRHENPRVPGQGADGRWGSPCRRAATTVDEAAAVR